MVFKQRVIIAASIVCITVVGWRFSAYYRGITAALFDHARGHYEVKAYGMPEPVHFENNRLLKERYGVAVDEAGCVVSEALIKYIDGYNHVSKSRLRARFSKDIFAECWNDARNASEKRNPKTEKRDDLR